ncbi:putative NAD binding Rossmann fold oxidoreductase [Aspergillus steynii IBT 23096]|uniref:Putative NAD binding Rossmann fold oxidoreductase n=1 Tax=Aspergillus steynii IBT 23096 TaxID=1392250 RepID=A0A2I2GIV8_9EURO|nr:putative NAD binding Rossmann fold oxidoreductase [Aspergillus steynii IBT 23096]PLB52811.1 putative NAD binding Rossmann fold oxidoreductase [Aspergillus steynii IBT 23096]
MAPSVLMVGTGEYTTGYVGGAASGSDKKVGVVGLTMFDLRRRGKVGKLSMVGVSGSKYPGIREHLNKNISQVYNGLDTSFDSYPADNQTDPDAYKAAIDALEPGSAITIFTPDPTHFPIALYAIQRKIHVLITKPATQLLSDHLTLLEEARKNGVFVFIEHHKRFDPAYSDARAKAQNLGDFNYFYSYMSQPKSQLETFKAWAGRDSDISYYLNSHHIDINESMVPDYTPVKVTASASKGTAVELGCVPETEDTITLLVDWRHKADLSKNATGVYTASWTAPQKAGVHSNQYFHYMGSKGEVRINQAKRGYDVTGDESGLSWLNPFYMRYAPDDEGNFAGQTGYGYISFEKFIDAVTAVNEGRVTLDQLDARPLPTLKNTIATTAILQAGRVSLDEKRSVEITSENGHWALK